MKIPFNKVYLTGKEEIYMLEALHSGQLCGNHNFCKKILSIMKEKYGFKNAFLVPSGTAALEMGVVLADIQPGDEVILPSYTFSSTVNAVVLFGGYWWLPLPILQNTTLIAVNQPLVIFCFVTQNQRGTKTGQNHGKIKSRTLRPKYPLWNTSVSFAKVQICPLKNEGKSLFLSFTTLFPTIVPQMWLLQTVLTSNGLVCENWVLNFVLHSVGHFQKRELAIEPKICHPYCPILGLVNV